MTRIDALMQFLEEDPGDSFSRYALAMEYVKLDRYEDAIAEYRKVIRNEPEYLATYYQLGKALEHQGLAAEAREAYNSGIAIAARRGDAHTRDELTSALELLEDSSS